VVEVAIAKYPSLLCPVEDTFIGAGRLELGGFSEGIIFDFPLYCFGFW